MMRLFMVTMTVLLLTACKKDKSPGERIAQDFITCNATQNLDSTAIALKLLGSWTWKKQSTYTNQFIDADKNIKATFNNNSTFSVVDGSNIITQGTWNVVYYSRSNYGLTTNVYSKYIGGGLYFCDNQLFFFNSPSDGVDNLFEK